MIPAVGDPSLPRLGDRAAQEMVLASLEAFWDDKPDGNLYAFARPWIDERITVSAEGDVDPLIDRLVAAAAEQEIGEVMELRASLDEVLVVWVDAETPARIGLNQANTEREISTWSLNGSGDSDGEVEARYMTEWEVTEPQIFIDQALARAAIRQYVRDRTLSSTVDWS